MKFFDWQFAWQILPQLLHASLKTVGITLVGFTLAMVFGLLFAMARRSRPLPGCRGRWPG